MKSFKSKYAELWDAWNDKNGGDTSKKPSKDKVIDWASKAWAGISRDTAVNGWKVYEDFRKEIEAASNINTEFFFIDFILERELEAVEWFNEETEDEKSSSSETMSELSMNDEFDFPFENFV
jgi:hypothetical protein